MTMNFITAKQENLAKDSQLPDVQSLKDHRHIALNQVGIRNLLYPMGVRLQNGVVVQTPAKLTLSVNLPAEKRGTHMSRFLEILNRGQRESSIETLPLILDDMVQTLDAERAYFRMTHTEFVEKISPVSRSKSFLGYESMLIGKVNSMGQRLFTGVKVPVLSLCPCSKEISDYGAHNQRSTISILVQLESENNGKFKTVWNEELVSIAETSSSASLYSLLKRSDERFITMQAYNNPVFVEDLIRNVAVQLKRDERIQAFRVKVINHESIHQHDAFAKVQWKRKNHTQRNYDNSH